MHVDRQNLKIMCVAVVVGGRVLTCVGCDGHVGGLNGRGSG